MKNKIEYVDSVYCKASKDLVKPLRKILRFKAEKWVQGPYGRLREEYYRYMIDGRNGQFLAGLLPRIEEHLREKGINYKVDESNKEEFPPVSMPTLSGIKLRRDQLDACHELAAKQRGLIIAPTGSGETIVATAIVKQYGECRALFLCHTLDLLKQTSEEFKRFGIDHEIIGGGQKYKGEFNFDVTLSTIQSFSKIDFEDYYSWFDMVIVDEAHHITGINTGYGKVLGNLLSPVRVGLTATPLVEKGKELYCEGLIGPIISKIGTSEAIKTGILAKPKLELISVPYTSHDLRSYKDIYSEKIIYNRKRNKLIIDSARKSISEGKSVLVIIEEIEHGFNLKRLSAKLGLPVHFVHGNTPKDERVKIKHILNKKEIKYVIASKVWREGINIPTLNHVINACGGRSELRTLQALGRGLRTAKGKKEILLTDFLDPYRYLAEHSIARMQVYLKEGWLA